MTKILVNEDKDIVAEVRAALKANDGYCPCKLVHEEVNKCMCQDFKLQLDGYCHCGLYYKVKE